MDRRDFLKIGAASAATTLVRSSGITASAKDGQTLPEFGWHPLTWSLIRRAEDASSGPRIIDTSQVERVIAETSVAQGSAKPPVIKWLPDPFSAFAHLKDYGLDELLEMAPATLWSRAALQKHVDDRFAQKNAVCPV